MSVHSLIQPGAFGPEAIAAMAEALEAAVRELGGSVHSEVMREVVAGRIIAAARFGERNPVRLRAAALALGEED
jgi:folate-dependent phosphoribosylglycinamide formyltransferase PurN